MIVTNTYNNLNKHTSYRDQVIGSPSPGPGTRNISFLQNLEGLGSGFRTLTTLF